jgi:hypothetical protein
MKNRSKLLLIFLGLVVVTTVLLQIKPKQQVVDVVKDVGVYQLADVQPTNTINLVIERREDTVMIVGGEYNVDLKVKEIVGGSSIGIKSMQLRLLYDNGLIISELPKGLGLDNLFIDVVRHNVTKGSIDVILLANSGELTDLNIGQTLLSFKVSSDTASSYSILGDVEFKNTAYIDDTGTNYFGTVPSKVEFQFIVEDQNTPPTISGSPATTINENEDYSFTPTASDADTEDTLRFSITGEPSWASFDTDTGKLSGKPSFSDAGDYNNIVISVTDGTATVPLPAFNIIVNDVIEDAEVKQPVIESYPPTTYNLNYQFSGTKPVGTGVKVGTQTLVAESDATTWQIEVPLTILGKNTFSFKAFKGTVESSAVSAEIFKHGVSDLRIDKDSAGLSAVDARDLAVFASSYYLFKNEKNGVISPIDPSGYRLSDMNNVSGTNIIGDGKIDAKDLSEFIKNWKRTYKYE